MKKEEFTKRFTYNATTDLLGSGGFGKVFKAWDNDAECYVAIKMQSVDPRYPGLRLSEEVEKAARLRHPNVARYKECYTFSTMDGTKDIAVMSYYEDGSLDKLLASGKLGREDIFSLLTEILEGIAYLHSEGIIHRDLKPQNVLILHHRGRYIPKITDFGISKQLDDGQSSAVSNSVLGGTRSYASPEQLKDSKIRKNTDLWSFGVITFQMLVGKLPFDCGKYSATSEEGRQEQFRQMMSGVLPEALDNVPEPWQRIIRECLIVDNERRIAHAEDCLAIIRGGDATAVEGNSTEDDPEPIAIPVEAVEVIPTPKPAPTPAPKVEPKSTPNPKPSAPATPAPKKRSKWWLWLLLLAIVGGGGFAYLNSQPKDNPELTLNHSNYTEYIGENGISIEMVWVEGGTFQMGSTNGDRDEQPVHPVTLSGYWIAETEVTQAQWEAVMGITVRQQRDLADPSWSLYGEGPNYPVYYVSYTEAMEFCRRLSSATGKRYTLPTEAQWEYAARGGHRANGDVYTYSGSDSIDNVAWYHENSNSQTCPVKQKSANQLGLYDMSGNVWEWCLDWYDSSYYSCSIPTNPHGPSSGQYRILRGGSWSNYAQYCRVAFRIRNTPSDRHGYDGFRVVRLP